MRKIRDIQYTGDVLKDIASELNYVKKCVAQKVAIKMHNKLVQVCIALIDYFYSEHAPTKYVRHGMENEWVPSSDFGYTDRGRVVKVYPNKGKNLYLGIDKEMPNKSGDMEYDGSLNFSPEQMMSYNYSLGDSPSKVLNDVFNGLRFPFESKGFTNTWMGYIKDRDLGELSGTPYEILDHVSKNKKLLDKYYDEAVAECKKELKLRYVDVG